jgi:ABC-type transport system involved in multi-copper enzyme maturation permease subunit
MVADAYSGLYAGIGLVLAFVIAPLAALGSLNVNRCKDMFALLLITRLSGREVVWQSFAAALVPGVAIWLCTLPVAAFLVAWWGIDPVYIMIVAAVALGCTLASVASAVAISLRSTGLFSTIVAVYSFWFIWLRVTSVQVAPGVFPGWASIVNPFILLLPGSRRISSTAPLEAVYFVAAAVVLTVVLLELSAATFRPTVLSRLQPSKGKLARKVAAISQVLSRRRSALRAPTLDGNPIYWREWRRARGALGLQAFWLALMLGAAVTTAIGARMYWVGASLQPMLAAAAGYELGIGALLLAIQASLVWSEEKNSGDRAIDVLLSTPLSAATIVNGKWLGVYRFIILVALFPVLSSLLLVGEAQASSPYAPEITFTPSFVAVAAIVLAQCLLYSAAAVSLGLFLATRCAKPTNAVFWAVSLYLVAALVLPTVTEVLLLRTNRPLAAGLAMVSPLAAPIAVIMTRFPGPYFGPAEFAFPYAAMWLVGAAGASWVLYRWTIQRFDRWMGRMPLGGHKFGSVVDRVLVSMGSTRLARAPISAHG